MLGHSPLRLVHIESQVDPTVEHADRLGGRVEQLPLGHRAGERVEADHLDRVLRVLGPDHGLKRDCHLLGRVILAVPAHGTTHVDEHDRGTARLILGLVHDVVFMVEPDRDAAPLANIGVLEGLVHVDVGQGVAVDVRPRVLELDRSLALVQSVVPSHAVATESLEEVSQSLVLDPPDALGRDQPLALLIALDKPLFLDQLDDLGQVVVVEVLQVAQDVFAILEHILRKLVEQLVGRLGKEVLRSVPFGILKQRHEDHPLGGSGPP